jgi:hypothetical protein
MATCLARFILRVGGGVEATRILREECADVWVATAPRGVTNLSCSRPCRRSMSIRGRDHYEQWVVVVCAAIGFVYTGMYIGGGGRCRQCGGCTR